MKKIVYLAAIIIAFSACKQEAETNQNIIELGFEKDLIPEGIAIHSESETVFLSSLGDYSIVSCKTDGSEPSVFFLEKSEIYGGVFGMMVKDDILYALGNGYDRSGNANNVLLFDVHTGEKLHTYPLIDTGFKYLNDLAVCSRSEMYISDSETNRIFHINPDTDELEVFFQSDEIAHTNGICVSDDHKYLYMASVGGGIRIMDLESKTLVNQANEIVGIDGLKFYNGHLYAMVNWNRDAEQLGLYKFELNEDRTEIIGEKHLVPYGEDFAVPTTFAIHNGYVYFNINSQLHLFDSATVGITDYDALQPYKMYKYKLSCCK